MLKVTPNFLNGISGEYKPEKDKSEYNLRPTVRVIVIDDENNIGLIRPTEDKMLFPPGGGIEKGEDMAEATRREVSEELGVICEFKEDLGTLEHYHEKWMTYFVIHHIYATSSREESKIDYEEYDTNLERVWMNIEEYKDMLDNYVININPNDIWGKAVLYFLNKSFNLF